MGEMNTHKKNCWREHLDEQREKEEALESMLDAEDRLIEDRLNSTAWVQWKGSRVWHVTRLSNKEKTYCGLIVAKTAQEHFGEQVDRYCKRCQSALLICDYEYDYANRVDSNPLLPQPRGWLRDGR